MTLEQMNDWAARPDVIMVDGHRAVHLHESDSRVIITIFWSHAGTFQHIPNREERFTINVSTGDSYEETKTTLSQYLLDINKYQYLLVNKHEPNYAILFTMDLSAKDRIFALKIKEYPVLGKLLISKDEENGITVKF